MNTPTESVPTHVAVPIELWHRTIKLIGKRLKIDHGQAVWAALQMCKPLVGAPKAKEENPEGDPEKKEEVATTPPNGSKRSGLVSVPQVPQGARS